MIQRDLHLPQAVCTLLMILSCPPAEFHKATRAVAKQEQVLLAFRKKSALRCCPEEDFFDLAEFQGWVHLATLDALWTVNKVTGASILDALMIINRICVQCAGC